MAQRKTLGLVRPGSTTGVERNPFPDIEGLNLTKPGFNTPKDHTKRIASYPGPPLKTGGPGINCMRMRSIQRINWTRYIFVLFPDHEMSHPHIQIIIPYIDALAPNRACVRLNYLRNSILRLFA